MQSRFSFKHVLSMKCPRCREGDLFEKPFSLNSAFKMHDRCPSCAQDYFPEPGFYYGAMFLGYIVSAWVFMILALLLVFGLGLTINTSFLILIVFAAITFIYFFRFARSLWIHIALSKTKK